jgi:hypothetical protein
MQLDLGQRRVVHDEVKVREPVAAAALGLGLESGRDQSVGCGVELPGGHEQVDVARLAQANVVMHGGRELRALQRQRPDAALGEQLHHATGGDLDCQRPGAGGGPCTRDNVAKAGWERCAYAPLEGARPDERKESAARELCSEPVWVDAADQRARLLLEREPAGLAARQQEDQVEFFVDASRRTSDRASAC